MTSLDEQISNDKLAKKSRYIKLSFYIVTALLLVALVWLVVKNLTASPLRTDGISVGSTATVPALQRSVSVGAEFDAESRTALQLMLSQTNAQVDLLAADPLLSRWQTATLRQLQEGVQQAYQLYGQQRYAEAATLLPDLQQQAQAYQTAYTDAYRQAHAAAMAAFTQADLQQATLHNSKTLSINPEFTPALQLQQRLVVAAEVLALWEQVRVAELENNPSKQKALLEKIQQLDGADQAATSRLAFINKGQQQQAFAQVLAEAVAALERNDFSQARQALARARAIDSSRPELSSVQQQLDRVEQTNAVTEALQQIMVFSAADEWPTVQLLANKALNTAPDNPDLQQSLQQAERIMAASQQLNSYVQQPERLTDANIQKAANAAIARAEPLGTLSSKLTAQILQLKQLLLVKQQPVAVRIQSDERTYIRVLGVGNVGEIKDKTIQLAPGSYQFEGACEGYRTEIITVAVHPSPTPIEVALKCKVRI
ncbi:hypothetical protein [Rheinheimera sp. UJ63]|uniref:hypothetical protein n=1 Tax=Rheinheimera sp. UJ63 TaxID=2910157 RepID=UPI001F2DC2F3|nr:hypothetical protein [Rheinheimera sp. UJ63]MCF4010661.1 hypothetical protein [Rheinheimera sp. UJ63]